MVACLRSMPGSRVVKTLSTASSRTASLITGVFPGTPPSSGRTTNTTGVPTMLNMGAELEKIAPPVITVSFTRVNRSPTYCPGNIAPNVLLNVMTPVPSGLLSTTTSAPTVNGTDNNSKDKTAVVLFMSKTPLAWVWCLAYEAQCQG